MERFGWTNRDNEDNSDETFATEQEAINDATEYMVDYFDGYGEECGEVEITMVKVIGRVNFRLESRIKVSVAIEGRPTRECPFRQCL